MKNDIQTDRVGFFVTSGSWVNHQQWHHEVSKALYGRGYHVSIITSSKGRLYARSKRNGMPVYQFKKRVLFLRNLFQLSRILRKEKISILFINNPKDLKTAALAARIAGVERVIYRKGTVSHVKKNLINKLIFTRLISGIITNSGANRDLMLREKNNMFHRNEINVIYNGLNLTEFEKKKLASHDFKHNGELVIGLLPGHFRSEKFLRLIQMVVRNRDNSHRYKFLIFGGGSKRLKPGKKLRALGLDKDLVRWDSKSRNLLEFMNSIDVFMSGSTRHSFNYPMQYAMALHKPVIGYEEGSSAEMIRNNSNGFLLKNGDLQGIMGKLEALRDDNLRKKLGEEAGKTIRMEFNFENSIDEIEKIIHS